MRILLVLFLCIAFNCKDAYSIPEEDISPLDNVNRTSNLVTSKATNASTVSSITNSTATTSTATSPSTNTTTSPTTTSPTTTSPTTNTTISPTNTTISPTNTTISPTTTPIIHTTTAPHKLPLTGKWHLTDQHTNETCILLQGGFRFTFRYLKDKKEIIKKIDLDSTAIVSKNKSFCHPKKNNGFVQNIELQMKNPFDDLDNLNIVFTSDDKMKAYAISSITGNFFLEKSISFTFDRNTTDMSKVRVGGSYECNASQNITDFKSDNENITLISIETDNFKYEAFRKQTDTTFAAATSCTADVVISNIVPIAVGAALACLVIVVLIAYLIGRRRSRRGYESV